MVFIFSAQIFVSFAWKCFKRACMLNRCFAAFSLKINCWTQLIWSLIFLVRHRHTFSRGVSGLADCDTNGVFCRSSPALRCTQLHCVRCAALKRRGKLICRFRQLTSHVVNEALLDQVVPLNDSHACRGDFEGQQSQNLHIKEKKFKKCIQFANFYIKIGPILQIKFYLVPQCSFALLRVHGRMIWMEAKAIMFGSFHWLGRRSFPLEISVQCREKQQPSGGSLDGESSRMFYCIQIKLLLPPSHGLECLLVCCRASLGFPVWIFNLSVTHEENYFSDIFVLLGYLQWEEKYMSFTEFASCKKNDYFGL